MSSKSSRFGIKNLFNRPHQQKHLSIYRLIIASALSVDFQHPSNQLTEDDQWEKFERLLKVGYDLAILEVKTNLLYNHFFLQCDRGELQEVVDDDIGR